MLHENSLYVDNIASRKEILKNKTKVMDTLMFNYFGFIALLATKPSDSGILKTYKNKDKSVSLDKIDYSNSDICISILLAIDSGIIDDSIAEKMLTLFSKLRNGIINADNFDNNSLINLLIKTKYQVNKPSSAILSIVDSYTGNGDINQFVLDLVEAANNSKYKDLTSEFRAVTKLVFKYDTLPDDVSMPTKAIVAKGTIARAQQLARAEAGAEKYEQDTFNNSLKTAWTEVKANSPAQFEIFYKLSSVKEMEEFVTTHPIFDIDKFVVWLNVTYIKNQFPAENTNVLYDYLFGLFKTERKTHFDVIGKLLVDKISYYSQSMSVDDIVKTFGVFKPSNNILDSSITSAMESVADLVLDHLVHKYETITPANFKELKDYTTNCIRLLSNYGTSVHRRLGDVIAQLLKSMGTNQSKSNDSARAFCSLYSTGVIYIDVQSSKYTRYLIEFLNNYFEYDVLQSQKKFNVSIYDSLYQLMSQDQRDLIDILRMSISYKVELVVVPEYVRLKDLFDGVIANESTLDSLVKNLASYRLNDNDYAKFVENSRRYIVTGYDKFMDIYPTLINSNNNNPNTIGMVVRLYKDLFTSLKDNPIPSTTKSKRVITDIIERMANLCEHEKDYTILNTIFDSVNISDLYSIASLLSDDTKYIFYTWINNKANVDIDFQSSIVNGTPDTLSGFVDSIIYNPQNTFLIESLDVAVKFVTMFLSDNPYTSDGMSEIPDYMIRLYNKHPTLRDVILNKILTDSTYKLLEAAINMYKESVFSLLLNANGKLIPDDKTTNYIVSYIRANISNIPSLEYFKGSDYILNVISNEIKSQVITKVQLAPEESLALLSSQACDVDLLNDILTDTDIVKSYKEYITTSPEIFSTNMHKIFNKVITHPHNVNMNTANNLLNVIKHFESNKSLLKSSERNSLVNLYFEIVINIYLKQPESADIIFDKVGTKMQQSMLEYVEQFAFVESAMKSITSDSNPIKPMIKLDRDKICSVLAINRIKLPENTKVEYIKGMKLTDMLKKGGVQPENNIITDLQLTPKTKTKTELEELSIEYDKKFNNKNESGQYSYMFMDEYDVRIQLQADGIKKFIENNPDTEIMDIAFHGTGTLAASMILRYGFNVITEQMAEESGVKFAGRSLGDGIYFSDAIDKAGSYAYDNDATTDGLGGYIFIMKAALGHKGKQYQTYKGYNNEWCVFFPNEQLMIYKAYRIKAVNPGTFSRIVAKHKLKENYTGFTTFANFINEAELIQSDNIQQNGDAMGTIKLIFMDGTLPLNNDVTIDSTSFRVDDDKASIVKTMRGTELTINANNNVNISHKIPFTKTFMVRHPELLKLVLGVIKQ